MSIVLRKAELQTLNEKSLRTQVLIPLFEAMGFKDVKETHGNIEYGRDIVMWRDDLITGRVNYAVVVKSKRVSAGRLLDEVVGQVQECFGKHYTDPISNKCTKTNAVLVILQKGITSNAQESLSRRLEAIQGTRWEVKTWDSDDIYTKCRHFLNPKTIWGRIDDLAELLKKKSEYFDFTFQVASTGDRTLFLSKKPSRSLEIEHSFTFSDNESGRAAREDYDRFLKSGLPLLVGAESISATEIPTDGKACARVRKGSQIADYRQLRGFQRTSLSASVRL